MRESGKYQNKFTPIQDRSLASSNSDKRQLISIQTVPQVAIGQRALLCVSPQGNVLWDCITYLDAQTVDTVKSYGPLDAIVISHPHYFSTCLQWAEAFGCPVYLSAEDEQWIMRRSEDVNKMVLWPGQRKTFCSPKNNDAAEFVCVKTGGHFPGSSVLYWPATRKLLVADTIYVVPSGVYHVDRPEGTTSFSFMWSYPNMVSTKLFVHVLCSMLKIFADTAPAG
jgi:glyoxylase-like metal-dependent hydrolase (beta-lactamase superfamily II)